MQTAQNQNNQGSRTQSNNRNLGRTERAILDLVAFKEEFDMYIYIYIKMQLR